MNTRSSSDNGVDGDRLFRVVLFSESQVRLMERVPWATGVYIVTAAVLLATKQARISWEAGTGWAIASAVLAVGALILLYAALSSGEASKVVPVTAAYPALTLVLSALFLSENVSPARIVGMLLVVSGVVLLTSAR